MTTFRALLPWSCTAAVYLDLFLVTMAISKDRVTHCWQRQKQVALHHYHKFAVKCSRFLYHGNNIRLWSPPANPIPSDGGRLQVTATLPHSHIHGSGWPSLGEPKQAVDDIDAARWSIRGFATQGMGCMRLASYRPYRKWQRQRNATKHILSTGTLYQHLLLVLAIHGNISPVKTGMCCSYRTSDSVCMVTVSLIVKLKER